MRNATLLFCITVASAITLKVAGHLSISWAWMLFPIWTIILSTVLAVVAAVYVCAFVSITCMIFCRFARPRKAEAYGYDENGRYLYNPIDTRVLSDLSSSRVIDVEQAIKNELLRSDRRSRLFGSSIAKE